MRRARDLLQAAVVAGNRIGPVSRIQRAAYQLAVRTASRRFGSLAAARSVYLRHSLAQGDWVPGLSDIDFTVVLEDDLEPGTAFAALDRLWARYEGCTRAFPMLGEVDVLTPGLLRAWAAFTIRGHESRGWQRISGTDTLEPRYVESPSRLAADSLDYALAQYLHHFCARFHERRASRYLARSLLARLADKIGRYATQYSTSTIPTTETATGSGDELDQLVRVVRILEAGTLSGPSKDSGRETASLAEPRREEWPIGGDPAAVACVLTCGGTVHVIVENGLDHGTLRRALSAVLAGIERRGLRALVTSESTFEDVVRLHAPFRYERLARERILRFGRDVMATIPPPSSEALARSVLEQSVNVLSFPGSRSFHRAFSARALIAFVERAMFIKQYLEHGSIRPGYAENLAACRELDPEIFAALSRLEAAEPAGEPVRRSWFERASRLADETAGLLSGSREAAGTGEPRPAAGSQTNR